MKATEAKPRDKGASSTGGTFLPEILLVLALVGGLFISWNSRSVFDPGDAGVLSVSLVIEKGDLAQAALLGSIEAPILFLEFSDYQCPFCGQFAREVHPTIVKEFVDTDAVAYQFFDFPLDRVHPAARTASEAAMCAGRSRRYWQMYDSLFSNQGSLGGTAQLMALAKGIGLDERAFGECLERGETSAVVQANQNLGHRLGVRATPTFMLGYREPDGSVRVNKTLSGAKPYSVFRTLLQSAASGLRP